MPVIIKEISVAEAFEIRHPVLRAGKPVESCSFEGDNLPTTIHFGLFLDDTLVGVVSVFESKSDKFLEEYQYQLRGMAVLPSEQGRRFGEKLLQFAEDFVRNERMGDIIWFNARSSAVAFYEKLGYIVMGSAFEIPEIGTHYVMFKRLE